MLLVKRTNGYKSLKSVIDECIGILVQQSSDVSVKEKVSAFLVQKLALNEEFESLQVPQELLTTDYASSSEGESLIRLKIKSKKQSIQHPGISEKESKIKPADFPRPIKVEASVGVARISDALNHTESLFPSGSESYKTSSDIKNVSGWIAKIKQQRAESAPHLAKKEALPPLSPFSPKRPKSQNISKINIDTLPTKKPNEVRRLSTTPRALPNGTVKINRPKSLPTTQKFGLSALLSSTEGSVRPANL